MRALWLFALLLLVSGSFAFSFNAITYNQVVVFNLSSPYTSKNATFGSYIDLGNLTASIGGTSSNGSDMITTCNYTTGEAQVPHALRPQSFLLNTTSEFSPSNHGNWNYNNGSGDFYMMVNVTANTALNCTIYLNPTTAQANTSDYAHSFLIGDNMQSNSLGNYTDVNGGAWSYDAANQAFSVSSATNLAVLYPNVQSNVSAGFTVEGEFMQVGALGGGSNHIGLCAIPQRVYVLNQGVCALGRSDSNDTAILDINNAYFGIVPVAIINNVPFTLRLNVSAIGNRQTGNFSYSQNGTRINTSTTITASSNGFAVLISNQPNLMKATNFRKFINPVAVMSLVSAQSTIPPPAGVSMNFTAPTPTDGSVANVSSFFVNTTVSPTIGTCNLYVNGVSYAMTAVQGIYCQVNVTGLADGNYSYNGYGYNSTNQGENASTANRTIIIDTLAPSLLNFTSPILNASNGNAYYYQNISFNLSFTEPNLAFCMVQINGTNNTMSNTSKGNCNFSQNNQIGGFGFFGYVKDLANHTTSTANFTVTTFNITGNSSNASTSINDLSTINFFFMVNISNYNNQTMFAFMELNGVNYSTSIFSQSGGNYTFNKTLSIPAVIGATTETLTWYYFFNNSSNPQQPFRFGYNNITVSPVNITDCAVTTGVVILNFTFFDQAALTTGVNSTMDGSFFVTNAVSGGASKNFSFNWTTAVPSIAICINATSGSYIVNSIQQFRAPSYRNLYYFLINQSITIPNSINVSLYNLNSSISTATAYTIVDASGIPQPAAYLQIYRYYPSLNQLILVSMGQTDINGIANSYAIPNDVIYRYLVIENAQIAFTSDSSDLSCNPASTLCSTTIRFSNLVNNEYLGFINNIAVGCSTVGNSVFCTSNNPSGGGTRLELKVWQVGTYTNILICDNILASGSGSVACTLPDMTQQYTYVGTATIGSIIVIGNGQAGNVVQVGLAANNLLGKNMGALAAIGLILGFAAVGFLGGFSGTIIMSLIGLTLSALIGFIDVSLVALVGLYGIGLVIAYVLRQ